MKTRTLLFTVFVFFNTICFAQEGWIRDKASGCKFFTLSNASTRYVKWDGACVDSLISGIGKLLLYQSDTLVYTYEGSVLNGKTNGQGRIIWASPTGLGYNYTNGNGKMFYVGGFINGHITGQGEFTSNNGDRYSGEWKDDEKNGQGIYSEFKGNKYVGDWKNDKMDGHGTYSFYKHVKYEGEVDSKYEGEWKDGKRSGQGTFIYPNGDIYVGDWKDDTINGNGTITYSNGNKYEGQWKDNKYNGIGTFRISNGSKYEGDWVDNKKNGYGLNIDKDGNTYEGGWKDDKYHGKGVIINTNKDTIIGEWDNGNIKYNAINFDDVKTKILSNNFTLKYVNLNCYSLPFGTDYDVVNIIKGDVLGYNGLYDTYNTQLKREVFAETPEYKKLNTKFNDVKKTFSNLCYYTYVDEFNMSDYNIEKGKFTIDFPEYDYQGLSGNEDILYRPINCFYAKNLFISFPSIPIKSVAQTKKYINGLESSKIHTTLNIDVNKISALEIENNKDKLRIYFIITDNIKKGNIFHDNFEIWVSSMKNETKDYYFANKVRMIIVNKETGEIYYSKLYTPAATIKTIPAPIKRNPSPIKRK